jgi:hypothetical protein
MISSFWHGFYGGYYLSFLFWFLQINLATKVFKWIQFNQKNPIVLIYNKLGLIGDIILWCIVNFLFSQNGLYFQILDSALGFIILKRILFIPPLIIVISIFVFDFLNKKSRKPKTPKDE